MLQRGMSFWSEAYCGVHKCWLPVDPFRGLIQLNFYNSVFVKNAKASDLQSAKLYYKNYDGKTGILNILATLREIHIDGKYLDMFKDWWYIEYQRISYTNKPTTDYEYSKFLIDSSSSTSEEEESDIVSNNEKIQTPEDNSVSPRSNESSQSPKRFSILGAFDSGAIYDRNVEFSDGAMTKRKRSPKLNIDLSKSYNLDNPPLWDIPPLESKSKMSNNIKSPRIVKLLQFEKNDIIPYQSNHTILDKSNGPKIPAWRRPWKSDNDDGSSAGVMLSALCDENGSLRIHDVTLRYQNNWSKIVKARFGNIIGLPNSNESSWLGRILSKINSWNHRFIVAPLVEAALIVDEVALTPGSGEGSEDYIKSPIPNTLNEFRHHPVYIIESQLKANQVILPKDPVFGYFKGSPVYNRKCLWDLYTESEWKRNNRTVKDKKKKN